MNDRRPLTPARRKVFDFMVGYQARHGCPPTSHEIAAALELSKVSVHEHLHGLVKAGWCREIGAKQTWRRIEAIEEEEAYTLEQIKRAVIETVRSENDQHVNAWGFAEKVVARLTGKAVMGGSAT